MLLAIDIGNTHTVLGLYLGDELVANWRLQSNVSCTVDEYALQILALLKNQSYPSLNVDKIILSSVVPVLTGVFVHLAKKYFSLRALVVGSDLKTGMVISCDDPKSVGADRIVNAVAMKKLYGTPAVLVDFGTATTFDVVDAKDAYIGGLIAPGFQISSDALYEKASMLPSIELKKPTCLIGRNTADSMLAGIVFGYIGLVDGILSRIKGELGDEVRVIATGGFASMVADESIHIEEVVPDLTLTGLRIVAEMNG